MSILLALSGSLCTFSQLDLDYSSGGGLACRALSDRSSNSGFP
jgi:hypothetical protein